MQDIKTVRDLRRFQIVAAARRIVAEQGLAALTISTLEQSLDYTRGVITYHFANKDDIVGAVLDSAILEIDVATTRTLSPGNTVDTEVAGIMRTKVEGFLDHVDAGRILMTFWSRIPADTDASTKNARLFATYRHQAEHLIKWVKSKQNIPRGLKPEGLAAVMVGCVIGVVAQSYFQADAFDREAAIKETIAVVAGRLRA
ncbi:MAG: TetR/AcrR family fatty acid metabolism transcriptional regulator [Myxococcota bacterium]|jgi:TetR/AcrR family fatty acid metabolism transcriptional regulator